MYMPLYYVPEELIFNARTQNNSITFEIFGVAVDFVGTVSRFGLMGIRINGGSDFRGFSLFPTTITE
jgi:ribosomal protein S6E (S10)